MTTENRGSFFTLFEAEKSISFLEAVTQARAHGESLRASGLKPQVIAAAVETFLLNINKDLDIKRNTSSPYDVVVKNEEHEKVVFLDVECHQLLLAISWYLSSEDQMKG